MNKYSYIALLLAVIIGIGVGHLFTNTSKNRELGKLVESYEKKIKEDNLQREQRIEYYALKIKHLEERSKLDSLEKVGLLHRIEQDGVVVNRLLKERKQWTNEEKVAFITDRYSN